MARESPRTADLDITIRSGRLVAEVLSQLSLHRPLDQSLRQLREHAAGTEARILDAIRAGNYLETAARVGGIHVATLHEWRRRFPEFSEAVDKARAEAGFFGNRVALSADTNTALIGC